MRARIEQVSPRMTGRMQLTLANCLQVNAMVKRHELLRGRPYQGDLALLEACVGIIVHCTALLIDLQASRQLNENFYDDDGNPWEHPGTRRSWTHSQVHLAVSACEGPSPVSQSPPSCCSSHWNCECKWLSSWFPSGFWRSAFRVTCVCSCR